MAAALRVASAPLASRAKQCARDMACGGAPRGGVWRRKRWHVLQHTLGHTTGGLLRFAARSAVCLT